MISDSWNAKKAVDRVRPSPRATRKRLVAIPGVIALTLAVGASTAVAAQNDLDSSFGGDGIVTTDFSSGSEDRAWTVDLDSSNRIVVGGGTGGSFFGGDFALARYNGNGSLDTSFSGDGKVATDTDVAISDLVTAGNKIIAFGRGILAQYDADGTLDTSFSGDGLVTTGALAAFGEGGVALSNGKIVVAGTNAANDDFVVARYNADGTPDTSFSGDGTAVTDFGGAERATEVAVQADERIVAVGGSAIARYNTNGTLDTSFSGDGKLVGFIGGTRSVTIQPDGKIVVGGGGSGSAAIGRLNSDGTSDATFSGDGVIVEGLSSGPITEVALQSSKVVAAVGDGVGAIYRYEPDGTRDTSFSGDGVANTYPPTAITGAGLVVQSDAKLVLAGATFGPPTPPPDFAIARFKPNGDNVAPDTAIVSGPAEGSTTTDNTPTFGFSSPDSDTSLFQCRVDGSSGDWANCTSPYTTPPLNEGEHTVEVRAEDQAANVDPTPASRTFIVNTAPPETTITSGPPDGSVIADPTPTFAFESNEFGTFQCQIDGGGFQACNSPFTTTSLPDGSHTFEVRAIDEADSPDPSPAKRTFTVSTAVPPPPPPPPTGEEPPPSDTAPLNAFTTGKPGGLKLPVTVPGPGLIAVSDAKAATAQPLAEPALPETTEMPAKEKMLSLQPSSVTATAAGTVDVKLKLAGKAKKKYKQGKTAKIVAAVSFTPTGGSTNTTTLSLKLKK